MASKNTHEYSILCGAHVYRCLQHFAMRTSNASKNDDMASRRTEVFLASATYSQCTTNGKGAKPLGGEGVKPQAIPLSGKFPVDVRIPPLDMEIGRSVALETESGTCEMMRRPKTAGRKAGDGKGQA